LLLEINSGKGAQTGQSVVCADTLGADYKIVIFVLGLGCGRLIGETDGFGCGALKGDAGVTAACGGGC